MNQRERIKDVIPNSEEQEEILSIWEASVRATHDFLTREKVEELKPMVKETMEGLSLYCLYEADKMQGFIGTSKGKIEMLFLHPDTRGKGYGKELISYAMNTQEIKYVDVNEQNPEALGFYEHLGFKVIKRSMLDDMGNPYPILHMEYQG